jgi:hypothetical protein
MSEIADKLKMAHLPSMAEIRAEAEATVGGKPVTPVGPDPRDQDEWTFDFLYTDKRGKRWEGSFTNKILSIREQQAVAVVRARLAGGLSWDAFDPSVVELNYAIAWMSASLKSSPDLKDIQIIYALWAQVRSHDERYFRRDEPSE